MSFYSESFLLRIKNPVSFSVYIRALAIVDLMISLVVLGNARLFSGDLHVPDSLKQFSFPQDSVTFEALEAMP